MNRPGEAMLAEIAEQPAALQRLLHDGSEEIASARRRIASFAPRLVLFVGRGTSGHAGVYAKYLTEVHGGLPTGFISPSSLTVYKARPVLDKAVVITVSQSGGSPDLVEATAALKALGALTVAVTNNAASALAAVADLHVDVLAGPEKAVAATKTYTSELLALYLLLVGGDASAVPGAAQATLEHDEQVDRAAERYRFTQRVITTGRGFSSATASEAALKLMETSYLSAQAFSAAELLHGPIAVLGPGVPVIAVRTPGAGADSMSPLLERLAAERVDVLTVGPAGGLEVATDGLPEELHPVVNILPLQRLAWRLALDRGEDPDRPRGLLKVTETW
ncbi:glucosamine--fructose-6-phosphate aminotransferase (isomerizing) [Motilibacter peucedani]|uniref:Glucosamine--fructose-6-phosphate aminotransferase (Isomerizing) n=1 Tax=Motilibacter peucedani TaxID=598650 RepID=A0A420XT84_9ACTN|nr:SIS domain-containing protein [Motilibacter peucedani]RKS80045.1 glucosamine--fructose-6-phosphate aminotransferase (isomerizing) [Motilibacter peucedani]